jgi:uncharacterized protein
MAFTAINKAPGVYIDEVLLPGAIPGVSTSNAAFVGPTLIGPTNEPLRFTNYTQFRDTFGEHDNPTVYTHHAVRGFFENGGSLCYVVRAGTASRASLTLMDRSGGAGRATLIVSAREVGTASNATTVEVRDASLANAVPLHREVANVVSATADQVTVAAAADAARFRPGDTVFIDDGANNERATVRRTSGATIFLEAALAQNMGAGTIRIADVDTNQTRIRLDTVAGLEPGSYVTITDGTNTDNLVVRSVEPANNSITLVGSPANAYLMGAGDPSVTLTSNEFDLVVTPAGGAAVAYSGLSMDARHSRYVGVAVPQTAAVQISFPVPPNVTNPPDNRPAVIAATRLDAAPNGAAGADDDLAALNAGHYFTAIDSLERIDDVNILCVPGRTDQGVQQHAIEHCERMQDRFAVLDSQLGASPDGVTAQRNNLASERGYAALYYPWLVITNPAGAGTLQVPPSGHVAGVYARTDNDKGVHKAPANEAVRGGVVALERTLSDGEQGPLNEVGVNVIRRFPGVGTRVWGARTIATSTQWRYVNVRRLTLFVEESIQEGTVFAVFEPNTQGLWKKVKFQVDEFLTRVWKDGALFGATAEQAFRVRVDEELNPPGLRALGQLVIEVIIIPATPAEFVVFRIIQDPTGAALQEQS